MILQIDVTKPGHPKLVSLQGSPLDVLPLLRETVADHGAVDLWLSWPIGAGIGGMEIPAGRSLDDEIRLAYAELQDPDLCFDDPAEEDMARAVIGALHCALIGAGAELVIESDDDPTPHN